MDADEDDAIGAVVAFDDLVLWLDDLGTQYAMQVASGSLSTSTQAAPGRINATLTLERAL